MTMGRENSHNTPQSKWTKGSQNRTWTEYMNRSRTWPFLRVRAFSAQDPNFLIDRMLTIYSILLINLIIIKWQLMKVMTT